MAEWIPIAATGGVLLVIQILVLIKLSSIRTEQAETVRIINLLMDMVEFQSDTIGKHVAEEPVAPEEQPSIISSSGHRKPTLIDETPDKPPPPPPAKLKRW